MNIILQNFKKITKNIVENLSSQEIKVLLGRERLRFTKEEILMYLLVIFEHNLTQHTFFCLYRAHDKDSYQNFMKNIALFSKLYHYLFMQINQKLSIETSDLNIVDSTLIPEKELKSIKQKDYELHRVTVRKDKKTKSTEHICGSKGFVYINEFKQVYSAKLTNINFSDNNFLKDNFNLIHTFGTLLADRGFNNKMVRERINSHNNEINTLYKNKDFKPITFISPFHYKEKKKLTLDEYQIYKNDGK